MATDPTQTPAGLHHPKSKADIADGPGSERLQALLQRREPLVRLVNEREAHGQLGEDDADLGALLDVEQVIEAEFPAVHDLLAWSSWLLADASFAVLHAREAPLLSCSLCVTGSDHAVRRLDDGPVDGYRLVG